MQRYARAVRDEFSEEIDYLEEQYRTVKGEVDTARESMRTETARLNTELQDATSVLRNDPMAGPATSAWVGDVPQNNVVSISNGQPVVPEGEAAVAEPIEEPKPAPLVF